MAKKTHEQYVKELSEKNPNLIALSEYTGSLDPIKVKCKLCGHVWISPRASNLTNKHRTKCLKCHNIPQDRIDEDCFALVYPEFAKWLVNKDEGYRYKKKSGQKADWICPYCGNIVKNISFAKIADRKHIPCKRCSDGVSFPNKVMYNLLTELNLDFNPEYSPSWISPKRYDFYIEDYNLIIEMDGSIGHGRKSYTGETDNNLLQVDKYKDKEAFKHGLNVIRIDSNESSIEYISNNIIKSELSSIFDLNCIDWNEIERKSFSSFQMKVISLWEEQKNVPYIMEKTKLSRNTVVKYLNKGAKSGICSYDPRKQQHLSGKRNIEKAYSKNGVSVVCIETQQIFKTLREANQWLGYAEKSHTIIANCNGKQQSAGKHPETKEKLHWIFYEDYIKNKEVS